MPFIKVDMIKEQQEFEELLKNPEAQAAYEQFEAECKLRRELAEARKKMSMTQAELRKISGLTQQAISRIETNHEISPGLGNLIKYAAALGYELTLVPKENRA